MTIIGIASRAGRRTRRGRSHDDRPQEITPVEARLLMLRPCASVVALPARHGGAQPRPASRTARSIRTYASVVFWLFVLTVFGIGSYVIDQGGHATPRSETLSPFASGSGRLPVTVTPGDVTVRVAVSAGAGPWFWCLESSRGLPPEQHLCRDSGATGSAVEPIVTDNVVHLDAASVRGATFYVQMYCRESCDWQADAE